MAERVEGVITQLVAVGFVMCVGLVADAVGMLVPTRKDVFVTRRYLSQIKQSTYWLILRSFKCLQGLSR